MRVWESRQVLAIGVLLLFALTLAVHGASQNNTTVVKDVVLNSSGESLEATISATGAARITYFKLDAPHRLVVDFHDVQNSVGFREKRVARSGVERVRTSFFSSPDRKATRIVFDLEDSAGYKVVKRGDGMVRVVFDKAIPMPAAPVAPVTPKGDTERAALTLVAGPPGVPVVQESMPALPMLSSQPLSLPIQQLAALSPAAVINASPLSALIAPVVSQITQALPPTTPTLTSPAQTQVYSGELVTLDLKDVDMKDFFRLIGDISGLNVFPDPNVTGSVTILARDLPWDQVLDVVLRNNNLSGQLQGNVLRIATNTTLQSEQDQRKALREAQAALVPTEQRAYILSYVKAADVVTMFRTAGAGILSPRGSILAEPRRNAIIVTDVADQFSVIEQMKKFIDVPSQQVEIEARLLNANRSFSRELGVQLAAIFGNNNGNILTGGVGESSPFNRTPPPRATVSGGTGIPLMVDLPAAATSGVAFLLQPGGDILLDAIITAAEAKGTAKLISRPKVTTQNNQAAVVSQGTQIPVQTNVNNTISVTFLNFALELEVTPQITEDGKILLTVNIENSQPDFARAVNGVPSVATQQAQSQVLIPDGATAMIAGILVDTDSVNVRQVPLLGSVPIIGHLFKNTATIKSTAELLFFITPRIKASDALTITAPAQ
jgi:type IV pilus assembly protein PilQ